MKTTDLEGYWICRGGINKLEDPKNCDVILLYLHGGGYCAGHPLSELLQLLRIAEVLSGQGLSISIFALKYSLAPEATMPTQIQQTQAAYRYLLEEAGVLPSKIVVMGESAGGHLALSFLHDLQKQEHPKSRPGGALLIYPWVDLTNSGDSVARNKDKCIMSRRTLNDAAQHLVGSGDRRDVAQLINFAAPKPTGYWNSVLPDRTWVTVGSDDLFVDSITSFVQHARDDKAHIDLEITKGDAHAWSSYTDGRDADRYIQLRPEDDAGTLMRAAKMFGNAVVALIER